MTRLLHSGRCAGMSLEEARAPEGEECLASECVLGPPAETLSVHDFVRLSLCICLCTSMSLHLCACKIFSGVRWRSALARMCCRNILCNTRMCCRNILCNTTYFATHSNILCNTTYFATQDTLQHKILCNTFYFATHSQVRGGALGQSATYTHVDSFRVL